LLKVYGIAVLVLTLYRLDERYTDSKVKKKPKKRAIRAGCVRQMMSITNVTRHVVITITDMTAIPARRGKLDLRHTEVSGVFQAVGF
jgi:hypothetical protein